uniref:Hematopoietic SH2 domain containing n=1 Tax=Amphilophus citrinellus TaxID=61819 RepID=A0A3Q0R644_AMPCI
VDIPLKNRQNDPYTWFTESQLQFVIKNGVVPEWFHGIISRKTAEELLVSKPPGYFLIRVSESRIGYTLSYRAEDRCRHFMIDALKDGYYIIVGENRYHRFLQDLVDFHRRTPIMPYSQVLTVPCGQVRTCVNLPVFIQKVFFGASILLVIYKGLSLVISGMNLNLDVKGYLLVISRFAGIVACMFKSKKKLKRKKNLCIFYVYDLQPAPMMRKRYMADNPPSNQPPEVPSRNCVALKQIQATRTVSAPESLPTLTGSEQPPCTNIPHVKNQEAKSSAVINLKNFKKKFHKKREPLQDNSYSEINTETTNRGEDAEHEYQEITGKQTFCEPPLSSTCTRPRLTDEVLPLEYMPPPPFAPGF